MNRPGRNYVGKVLVLGQNTGAFLSIVRSLGRNEVCVHVGWGDFDNPEFRSRYIRKFHDIPRYTSDNDDWKGALIELFKREHFDLVVPIADQSIIPFQLHREELGPHANIVLLSDTAFDVAFNKYKTWELAKKLEINVADGMLVSDMAQAPDIVERFSFPLVLKPLHSYPIGNPFNKQFMHIAHTVDEFEDRLHSMLYRERVLVQHFFGGTDVGVEVLAKNGKILVAFQHQRIRGVGGDSTYRKSMPLSPKLLEASARMVRSLDHTGVAMVEFRMDLRSGRWILVEINGRFWGSLPLAIAVGVDFPWYLYQMLVDGKEDFPQKYRIGVYCRNFMKDMKWILANIAKNLGRPLFPMRLVWQLFCEFVNILTLREHSDTFVFDDLKPGFTEVGSACDLAAAKVKQYVRLAWMTCFSSRRRYSSDIHRAIRDAKNILFVCKGNICRSPFAQYYAGKILPAAVAVGSTGFFKIVGRIPPPEAIAVGSEFGVDLSVHRSTIINENMMQSANVIFIFDESNYSRLVERFPSAKKKIYRLGLLLDEGPFSIEDPFGGTPDTFRAIYRRIALCLGKLVQ